MNKFAMPYNGRGTLREQIGALISAVKLRDEVAPLIKESHEARLGKASARREALYRIIASNPGATTAMIAGLSSYSLSNVSVILGGMRSNGQLVAEKFGKTMKWWPA